MRDIRSIGLMHSFSDPLSNFLLSNGTIVCLQVFEGRRQLHGAAAMVYDTMSFYVMLYSMMKVRPGPGMDMPKVGNLIHETGCSNTSNVAHHLTSPHHPTDPAGVRHVSGRLDHGGGLVHVPLEHAHRRTRRSGVSAQVF